MDEQPLLIVPFKDVVTALVRQSGLHEGKWALHVEFGLGAANLGDPSGALRPAAIVPVVKLGLRRVEALDDLSVDAAEVNPIKAKPERKRSRAKAE